MVERVLGVDAIGADADAEMTAICGMSFVFSRVLTTEPTSYY